MTLLTETKKRQGTKEDSLESRKLYNQLVRRKFYLLFATLAILLVLFVVDVITGPAWLSPGEVFSTIFSSGGGDEQTNVIVWVIRLPIAVMAVVVGASLGVAGAEMQTILDNSLASPYTLGISAAASFGAALAIVLGKSILPFDELLTVPANAFIFAMLSSLLIYFVAKTRDGSTHMLILVGITFSFLFNSLVSFLEYIAKDNELQAIVFWMFGSLQDSTWLKVGIVSGIFVIVMPFLVKDAWKLTSLKLGENKARSMGVNVSHLRLKVMFIVSVITAVSVCFVGTIGFIGLVAPHIARTFLGEDQRFFLPGSALFGALILSFASIVSKTIIPGAIFPIGITTSFIGIPFLLSIIFREKRSH